jgi:hypothetical protein
MPSNNEPEGVYSKAELREIRKLLRAIRKLSVDDIASLTPIITGGKTDVLKGAFEAFETRLELSENLDPTSFSAWDHAVRQALNAELRRRGVIYIPKYLDEFLPENWRELLREKKKP